jgi:glyoxylase-like metal-dependent hydrolase (beta-lactamase superfamily II)
MTAARVITRRTFLAGLGRGTVAVAVVGIAGCAANESGTTPRPTKRPSGGASAAPPASAAPSEAASAQSPPPGGVTWERVELGVVSAYILARGGEAALVDTGNGGSEDAIEGALAGIGLDWGAVGHVILTHLHRDHIGSAAAVLERAPDATGYAGAEDIPGIDVPRALTAVGDGDSVFDLRIVATPGHTPGHIAVHDAIAGILVAGDALTVDPGQVVSGSNPRFTDDEAAAMASVAKLGALRFETLLVGHGDPITSGASELVAALAAEG